MVDNYSIWFGVCCDREENEDKHGKFKRELEGFGGRSDSSCPWWRYPRDLNLRNPTRDQLGILASEERRGEYVKEIVIGVRDLWREIERKNLAC